jgi:hypothetical protein
MTLTNGNGDANSIHPTKDQTVDITQGQTAVELTVAGGPADIPDKERKFEHWRRLHVADSTEPNASIPANKLFSLAHTAVIVTGGARGLGLATAIALLESHSPHVYCTDILPSPAEAEWKIAQETAEKYGSKVEYRQLDITNEETVDKTFESMYNDCETPIGAFFGAAGIQQQIPALDYPAKDFRRIMEVNVTGESPAAGNETDKQVRSSRSRLLLVR